MTLVTESDLRELKDLINTRFDRLSQDIAKIKVRPAKIEAKTEGLEKRVDDINGRLNVMAIGFFGFVGILVTGILGVIGKLVFFPNP